MSATTAISGQIKVINVFCRAKCVISAPTQPFLQTARCNECT